MHYSNTTGVCEAAHPIKVTVLRHSGRKVGDTREMPESIYLHEHSVLASAPVAFHLQMQRGRLMRSLGPSSPLPQLLDLGSCLRCAIYSRQHVGRRRHQSLNPSLTTYRLCLQFHRHPACWGGRRRSKKAFMNDHLIDKTVMGSSKDDSPSKETKARPRRVDNYTSQRSK